MKKKINQGNYYYRNEYVVICKYSLCKRKHGTRL